MTSPTISEVRQVHVKLAGSALGATTVAQLVSVEVDDSLYLPSMATLEFNDPPDPTTFAPSPLTDANTLKIGAAIEIAFDTAAAIFKGEITSIEPNFNVDGFSSLVVRAYDKGHRLLRTKKTRTFLQMSDSDVISQIAREAGLQATVTSTSVVHDYLLQNNQTNYEFIQERAARAGHVIRTGLDELISKPLDSFSDTGPELRFGNNLVDFRPRLTAMAQPDSVQVRGWDEKQKQAIVSDTSSATPATTIGADRGTTLGSNFGESQPYGEVTIPMMQTSEADKLGLARLGVARNGDIQAEGKCMGDSAIAAGTKVKISGTGTLFSGTYLVTRARHAYTPVEGYMTYFESTNGTGETTAALVAPEEHHSGFAGPVIGVVTDINDTRGMFGRVKVKFPWMVQNGGQDIESWWARMATPMAGNGRGFMFLPEVNDEVLVAFEHGDVRRPYIIGALWNGQDTPPLAADAAVANGKVKQRVIKSTVGHIITIDDSDDAPLISIVDKTGKNKITIDSSSNKISVEADGDIEIKAAQKVTVTATSDISVKGDANIKIEAGAELSLKATSGMKLDGGAQVEIKGGTVKIN